MTTIHLGDCSTGCNVCAFRCAERNHDGCIGTPEERRHGDSHALMLDALRDALNELETLVRCDNANDPVTNATTDMRIDKVRAAIAAATGED